MFGIIFLNASDQRKENMKFLVLLLALPTVVAGMKVLRIRDGAAKNAPLTKEFGLLLNDHPSK
jgi:hypothetical protein